MILNPLSQVLIFAFVLSAVLSAKLPGIDNQYAYAIYLMAGTLGWSLFAEIVNRCLTLFIDNGNILKKLVFPKIALPLIVTGSALVNNTLLFVAILLIFGVLGHLPSYGAYMVTRSYGNQYRPGAWTGFGFGCAQRLYARHRTDCAGAYAIFVLVHSHRLYV